MRPPGGDLERFRTRDHFDGLPGAVFHAKLASDTYVEVDFYELLVLVVVRAGDGKYAVDRTKLDTDLATRTTGLIDDSQFLRTLLCFHRGRRGNRAYDLIRHETQLRMWKNGVSRSSINHNTPSFANPERDGVRPVREKRGRNDVHSVMDVLEYNAESDKQRGAGVDDPQAPAWDDKKKEECCRSVA